MAKKPEAVLLDADIICYQIASMNQQTFWWDEDTVSEVIDHETAIGDLETFIEDLLATTGTQKVLFCFSSSPNFRHEVLPTYKHNRSRQEKPQLFYDLQDYLQETYPDRVRKKPNLEADDVIGILATMSPGRFVIASLDKDLKQIPGLHYNWRKDEFTDITTAEADRYFYLQVLTGDPTDGYKGCPGIGIVKAERILDEAGDDDPWPLIVKTYESKNLTEEDALQQARVARILRATDYDFEAKKPILWTPGVIPHYRRGS